MMSNVENLIASTGLFSIGFCILLFAVPLFAVAVGSSESELGFIALAYYLPSFLMPLVVGRLLDKANAGGVIKFVIVAHALSTLLLPCGSNFLEVAGIRAIQGLFGIIFWVAMEKKLSDVVPRRDRGRVLGFYNASWGSAFIMGPLLGGLLIDRFDFKTTFLAAFLSQAVALAFLLKPREIFHGDTTLASSTEDKETTLVQRWEPRDLMVGYIASGTTGAVLGILFALFPAYVTRLGFSVLWAGVFMLLFSASRLATFLGVGLVTGRIGERKFTLVGTILSVSVIALGLTGKAELFVMTLLILGLASGMTQTAALTLVSGSPSRERGSAIGKYESSFNLGVALMSQLGGIAADLLGSWSPYVITGVVALFGSIALLALFLDQEEKRKRVWT